MEKENKTQLTEAMKSLVAPIVVGSVVALTNISVMKSEMSSVKEAVEKLDQKVEKMDGQVRQLELGQTKLNTLISNPSLLAGR